MCACRYYLCTMEYEKHTLAESPDLQPPILQSNQLNNQLRERRLDCRFKEEQTLVASLDVELHHVHRLLYSLRLNHSIYVKVFINKNVLDQRGCVIGHSCHGNCLWYVGHVIIINKVIFSWYSWPFCALSWLSGQSLTLSMILQCAALLVICTAA